jgi:hypothetical protein
MGYGMSYQIRSGFSAPKGFCCEIKKQDCLKSFLVLKIIGIITMHEEYYMHSKGSECSECIWGGGGGTRYD